MADKLKRCPFCGGEASIYHGDSTDGYIKGTDYVMAFCGWCGASIREKKEEEVIKAWNNRPSPWHTGKPTEEGWYLMKHKINGEILYNILENPPEWVFKIDDAVEWQKIEP